MIKSSMLSKMARSFTADFVINIVWSFLVVVYAIGLTYKVDVLTVAGACTGWLTATLTVLGRRRDWAFSSVRWTMLAISLAGYALLTYCFANPANNAYLTSLVEISRVATQNVDGRPFLSFVIAAAQGALLSLVGTLVVALFVFAFPLYATRSTRRQILNLLIPREGR